MKIAPGRRCFALTLAAAAMLQGCNPPNYPTGTIEKKYYAPGSWAVTVQTGGACCDSLGNKYDLYYPTNLGANGFRHPILTWGNGSFGKPSQVAYLLDHMASWGFVVIASEDPMTGPGRPYWMQQITWSKRTAIQRAFSSTSQMWLKLERSDTRREPVARSTP